MKRIGVAVAVLALVFLATPTSAATVIGGWQATLGTGGANGTVTINVYPSGSGFVVVKLTGLAPWLTYDVAVRAGTCAKPVGVVLGFGSFRPTLLGKVSKTVTLTASEVRNISVKGKIIHAGSRCAAMKVFGQPLSAVSDGLKMPFTRESGPWVISNGYSNGSDSGDHATVPGTLYALDFARSGGATAGSTVVAPASGTITHSYDIYDAFGNIGYCFTMQLDGASLNGQPVSMELCHTDLRPVLGHIKQGQYLGHVASDGTNSHIHIALFASDGNPTVDKASRVPIPFAGYWRLENGYPALADTSTSHTCVAEACPVYLSSQPEPASPVAPQNGDFESPVVNPPWQTMDGTFGGWQVVGAGVDLVRTEFIAAAHGTQSVDLNSTAAGGVEQTFALPTGDHRLMFELSGNPDTYCGAQGVKRLPVLIDGAQAASFTFDTTGHSLQDPGWVSQAMTFTSTMPSTTIEFLSDTPSTCAGPMIDFVRVQ